MSELPTWAEVKDGSIQITPAGAYPEALAALGVETPDQYWLEVARRCFEERVTRIARADLAILNALGSMVIVRRILRDSDFALANFPPGLGAEQGSQGFRQYYQTYLNGLPKTGN